MKVSGFHTRGNQIIVHNNNQVSGGDLKKKKKNVLMKLQQKVLTASSKRSWFINEDQSMIHRSNMCPSFPQFENLLVLVAAWYVTAGCVMVVFSNILVKQKFMNNSFWPVRCQVLFWHGRREVQFSSVQTTLFNPNGQFSCSFSRHQT